MKKAKGEMEQFKQSIIDNNSSKIESI